MRTIRRRTRFRTTSCRHKRRSGCWRRRWSIPLADVFCWIDYGIFHVPGVTERDHYRFFEAGGDEQAITIPGCWDKDYVYDDDHPVLAVLRRSDGGAARTTSIRSIVPMQARVPALAVQDRQS